MKLFSTFSILLIKNYWNCLLFQLLNVCILEFFKIILDNRDNVWKWLSMKSIYVDFWVYIITEENFLFLIVSNLSQGKTPIKFSNPPSNSMRYIFEHIPIISLTQIKIVILYISYHLSVSMYVHNSHYKSLI